MLLAGAGGAGRVLGRKRLDPNALFHLLEKQFADPGHQQREAASVREKPGRQQQRAGEEDHRTVGQRLRGVPQLIEGAPDLTQRQRPLGANQGRSQDRCDHDDQQGRPQADGPADLDEQGDFDQRNRDEGGK